LVHPELASASQTSISLNKKACAGQAYECFMMVSVAVFLFAVNVKHNKHMNEANYDEEYPQEQISSEGNRCIKHDRNVLGF
jgi:hypothetical protein